MVRKVLSVIGVALFLWLAPGCTEPSPRDQALKNLQDMHQKVRADAKNPQPPGKWVMNPDSNK